ncbi:hypothetical protein AK830_g1458 [Neonectria ditissima]|uniref:F-box domain-containing protein n=1 Tax=Neonectria ditissima TaxID=78410 RepID=A0A0P7BIN1_9HYPO|nr:hypothetical protein AK830_g1458 [Neonectria ditissima]
MTLTPIRIRGKRKSKATSNSNPPSTLRESHTPLPGRTKKMKRSISTVLADRSSRYRPSLDALPAEILEKILLYSANLSLPRAAPHIGAKLSGRVTLLRFFIWAFHDTWNQWFGIPVRGDVMFGPEIKHPELRLCDGDPVLQVGPLLDSLPLFPIRGTIDRGLTSNQSAILQLPWVNIDFILQAQQTWANIYAKDRWYQHSIDWDIGDDGLPTHHHDDNHDFDGGFGHFDARLCFEADYQRALSWQPFEASIQPWGFRDVHPLTRIPTSLITGPWDDEQQRRLLWLTRGGALNLGGEGHAPSPPWEVRIEFLRNAVVDASEPNVLVCNCLVRSWMYFGLPPDVVRQELRKIRRRVEWGGDTPAGRMILREVGTTLSSFLTFSTYEKYE